MEFVMSFQLSQIFFENISELASIPSNFTINCHDVSKRVSIQTTILNDSIQYYIKSLAYGYVV